MDIDWRRDLMVESSLERTLWDGLRSKMIALSSAFSDSNATSRADFLLLVLPVVTVPQSERSPTDELRLADMELRKASL